MKILATDLDRTLLPNGSWPADTAAIDLFNELTETHAIHVIYVTGRNLALAEQAISEFGIRHPHVLIGDVGTSIRLYQAGQWRAYDGWDEHVKQSSARWNAKAIAEAIAGIDGLVEQEREHCSPFKQSYYVEHSRNQEILHTVDERVKGKFDEVSIYSFDSLSGQGLLDFLPRSASKQTALEYLADKLDVAKSEIVFCGDSGNDVLPLTAGFRGVLVRNADEQLVADVKRAMASNRNIKAYFATGGFEGLNGYYASGVIEGANHYGLFRADD